MRNIALGFGLLAGIALLHSVEPGRPSRTAVVVLQHRALGAKLANPHLHNPNTLAGRFLGVPERQVLREINQPVYADMDFEEAWSKAGFVQRLFLHVLARTRAIDETVSAALRDGAVQMAILGQRGRSPLPPLSGGARALLIRLLPQDPTPHRPSTGSHISVIDFSPSRRRAGS